MKTRQENVGRMHAGASDDATQFVAWSYWRALRCPTLPDIDTAKSAVATGGHAAPVATIDDIVDTATEPSAEEFFTNHVLLSVPLILRGGIDSWPALSWSPHTLGCYGDEVVTVAPLQASGQHAWLDKWIEPALDWEHEEPEPEVVDDQQLLVVSAMRIKMPLRHFLGALRVDDATVAGARGLYADGANNLEHSFPFLADHFASPPFASVLELKRVDLWIGHRSISRMHYDNFDSARQQSHSQALLARVFAHACEEQTSLCAAVQTSLHKSSEASASYCRPRTKARLSWAADCVRLLGHTRRQMGR